MPPFPLLRHLNSPALALILLGFAAGNGFADDPTTVPEPADELLGRWTIAAGVNQGQEIPDAKIAGNWVLVTPETIATYDRDEKELYKAAYRLDRGVTPHQIDLVSRDAEGKQAKALGIFKETEEGWVLCYALPGADRPETFESPEGSRILLFDLRRSAPGAAPPRRPLVRDDHS